MFHVKKLLIYTLFLFVGKSFAQTDTLEIHYFKSGKVSSIQLLENNRFGKALAYNEIGALIFEQSIRRIGGHASVYFSYYESGAIKKAEYSTAPDGGIQWYKSYSEFNEKGERTNFYEMSNEQLMHPFTQPSTQPIVVQLIAQDAFKNNEIIIVNETNFILLLKIVRDGMEETTILEKKKMLRFDQIFASSEKDFDSKFSFTYTIPNAKSERKVKLTTSLLDQTENKQLRLYTFKKK